MAFQVRGGELMNKKKGGIASLYSIGLAFLPIFAIMKYEVAGIFVDRIFLLLFAVITILAVGVKKRFQTNAALLFSVTFYALVLTFNSLTYGSCGLFGIASLWIILLINLCFSSREVFKLDTFKKVIVTVSIVATIIMIVQYILFYVFGINWLPIPKNIYRPDIIEEYYTKSNIFLTGLDHGLYRPSAFFMEPSHFSEYAIVGLALELFYAKDKTSFRIPVILTAGIVLSTSGLGILCAVIAWGYKLFIAKTTTSKKIKRIFAVILALSVMYFILDSIGIANLILSRFGTSNISSSGFNSRFGDVTKVFSQFDTWKMLFGEGYDSQAKFWLSGWFSVARQVGLIGVIALVSILISIGKRTNVEGRWLLIIYAFLLVVAEVSSFSNMVFYLTPVIACGIVENGGLKRNNGEKTRCTTRP